MRKIVDEFTELPVSRQRRYALRRKADGKCMVCGDKAVSSSLCKKHLVNAREAQRKRAGSKGRYQNAKSYSI